MNDLENVKLKFEKLTELFESKTIPEYKIKKANLQIDKQTVKVWADVITEFIEDGMSYKEFCKLQKSNLAFVMEKCNEAYKILIN